MATALSRLSKKNPGRRGRSPIARQRRGPEATALSLRERYEEEKIQ